MGDEPRYDFAAALPAGQRHDDAVAILQDTEVPSPRRLYMAVNRKPWYHLAKEGLKELGA